MTTMAAPKGQLSDKSQETLSGFMFIAPALLIVIIFTFIPLAFAFRISFTDWTGLETPDKAVNVDFKNYEDLLFNDGGKRDEFFKALKNTFYYTIGVVPAQTIISLLLALIINQRFLKGRSLFRTAFYFPSITSSIVISMIFLWLFNKEGIINRAIGGLFPNYREVTWLNDPNGVIHNLLGLNIRNAPDWMKNSEILGQRIYDWISGPSVTMLAIMILAVWTTAGTMMLIFLAALQDIPRQLYEAASVDGATAWQQFWKITIPSLRPTTFFVITIGFIGCFQVFDQIYVITTGAPAGTTNTIAWIVYRNAFRDSNAGLGAATAFILFVIIAIFTVFQRRITNAKNA
jgi:multiple sugar transport system permease protein